MERKHCKKSILRYYHIKFWAKITKMSSSTNFADVIGIYVEPHRIFSILENYSTYIHYGTLTHSFSPRKPTILQEQTHRVFLTFSSNVMICIISPHYVKIRPASQSMSHSVGEFWPNLDLADPSEMSWVRLIESRNTSAWLNHKRWPGRTADVPW